MLPPAEYTLLFARPQDVDGNTANSKFPFWVWTPVAPSPEYVALGHVVTVTSDPPEVVWNARCFFFPFFACQSLLYGLLH